MSILEQIIEKLPKEIKQEIIDSYDETNSRDEAVEKGRMLGFNQCRTEVLALLPDILDVVKKEAKKLKCESSSLFKGKYSTKIEAEAFYEGIKLGNNKALDDFISFIR